MAEYLIQGETLTAIADALREKTGNASPLSPSQMADEIMSISPGDGSGGKSKVIQIYTSPVEFTTDRPAFMLGTDMMFFKISDDVITLDELNGGIVGSPRIGDGNHSEYLNYYGLISDLEEIGANALFVADSSEFGFTGAVGVGSLDGSIVAASFSKEGVANAKEALGIDVSEGLWVNAEWIINSESYVAFALAYNAKEPEEEWIGDGNTHIWIELSEERKSPMLGLAVNGSAVVDWGDGTSPDVLTGTSSTPGDVLWTPKHEYSRGGEYVITLTVDGQAGIGGVANSNAGSYLLRNSTENDGCNIVYRNAIKRVELGTGIVNVGTAGLGYCYSLRGVKFPESKLNFSSSCMFTCRSLERINMSNNDSPLGGSMFSGCEGLREVVLAESITVIPSSAFSGCAVLTYIKIPGKVSSVMASAFNNCYSMKVCDFTDHSAVPTLSSTGAFNNVPVDCEIRVPAALAEEWKAANNWSTYASKIVGV